MARLAQALRSLAEGLLGLLLQVLLVVIYFLVALPIGLVWRWTRPHASWLRAKTTRWEAPE